MIYPLCFPNYTNINKNVKNEEMESSHNSLLTKRLSERVKNGILLRLNRKQLNPLLSINYTSALFFLPLINPHFTPKSIGFELQKLCF